MVRLFDSAPSWLLAPRGLAGGGAEGAAPQPCRCQQPLWKHHPCRRPDLHQPPLWCQVSILGWAVLGLTGGTWLPLLCFPPSRYVVLSQPICLEQGVSYTLRLELGCAAARQDPTASVLIDSVRGRWAVEWGTAG